VSSKSLATRSGRFDAAVDLHAPVDVYAAWIDACDDEAEATKPGLSRDQNALPQQTRSAQEGESSARRTARTLGGDDDEGEGYEADDFVVDDEEDGGKDFEDDDDEVGGRHHHDVDDDED
jgi:transcription elongation factor Elf1